MKPIKFLPIMLMAATGLLAACSTSKLAQTNSHDDVYNTLAKAKEVEVYKPAPQAQPQTNYNDEYYGTSNPYYDMDYSSRINRFYGGYSWRGYYDPYFDAPLYSNYLGYGLSWSNGYGLNYGLGYGFGYGNGYYGSIWNNPFYVGYGYYNGWGGYSIYDRYGYGYYGNGYYGGGYYSGYVNRNNNHRPSYTDRNTVNSNGYYPDNGGSRAGSFNGNRPSRISDNGNTTNTVNPNYGRPSRVENTGQNAGTPMQQRPSREYVPQPQAREYTPPSQPSYSPPAQSSGGSRSQSSGAGGGGGSSRGGRN